MYIRHNADINILGSIKAWYLKILLQASHIETFTLTWMKDDCVILFIEEKKFKDF